MAEGVKGLDVSVKHGKLPTGNDAFLFLYGKLTSKNGNLLFLLGECLVE